ARRRLRGALHRAAAQPAAAILPRRRRQRLRARADLAGPAPAEVVAAGGAEAAAGTRVAATCHARQARRIRVLLLPVAALTPISPSYEEGEDCAFAAVLALCARLAVFPLPQEGGLRGMAFVTLRTSPRCYAVALRARSLSLRPFRRKGVNGPSHIDDMPIP